MQLKWVGDSRYVVGVGGWQAADHDEPDRKVAKAKLKSGLYVRAVGPEEPVTEGPAKEEEAS